MRCRATTKPCASQGCRSEGLLRTPSSPQGSVCINCFGALNARQELERPVALCPTPGLRQE